MNISGIFKPAVSVLLLAGVFAMTFAQDIGDGSTVVFTDGTDVIASGTVVNDEFELHLQSGFSGFAQVTVTAADGTTGSYEATVSDAGIILVVDGEFVDLAGLMAGQGVEFKIDLEDESDAAEDGDCGDAEDEEDDADGDDGDEEDDADEEDCGGHDDDEDDSDDSSHGNSEDDEEDDEDDEEDKSGSDEDDEEDEGDSSGSSS